MLLLRWTGSDVRGCVSRTGSDLTELWSQARECRKLGRASRAVGTALGRPEEA